MVIVRWAASMAMAVMITFGLFFFMQALIATGEGLDEPLNVVKIVDSTMPEIELEVIEEIDKPELIEEITEVVEEVERQVTISDGPDLNIDRSQVQMDTGLELSNASISATDGDYLPLVAIAPQYPTRAAQRGIQGWCLVSFTVDGLGNVVEETITVVDAEPANIFDRSSERAAARFKFQPRVVDGKGVEVAGVQYLFRYELED
ncbi:energy transducer TonB [Gammaproteobacteria bacterium]|jgi:protein TonB|nr:energy transducer TonB [Gammaproteobacteria bacterium]MCH9855105.1 energy transducer TonB [Gammaproteobacteria bacterium]MDA7782631.1 energy transducer TonB [Gammaproteobacteria bacterium]MDA8794784.1 energy transducer TonB [Gammaproteobacteria bacterium]MDA9296638.1 energy transducer TonB [Gammaproteobacteria bacterium]